MKDTEHHSDDALLMDLLYEESNGGGDGSAIDPQLRKQLTERYREELEAYREIRAAYRSLEEEDPAPQASAKILREASKVAHAAAGPGLVDRFFALFRLPSFGWAGAAAVALLVVGVGVFVSNKAESPDAARGRSGDVSEGLPAPSKVAAGDDEDVAAADGVTAAHGATGMRGAGKDEAARLEDALARGEAPATGGSEPMAVPSDARNAGLDGAGMPPPAPAAAAAAPTETPADERLALGGGEGRAKLEKTSGRKDAPAEGGGSDWDRGPTGKTKDKGSSADGVEDEESIAFESKVKAVPARDVPAKGDLATTRDAKPAVAAKSTPAAPAPPPEYAKADTAPRPVTSAGSSAGYYGSDKGIAAGAGGAGASSGSTYRSSVAPRAGAPAYSYAPAGSAAAAAGPTPAAARPPVTKPGAMATLVPAAAPAPGTAAAYDDKTIAAGEAALKEASTLYRKGTYGPAGVKVEEAKRLLPTASSPYAEARKLEAHIAAKTGDCLRAEHAATFLTGAILADLMDREVTPCYDKKGDKVAATRVSDLAKAARKTIVSDPRKRIIGYDADEAAAPSKAAAKPSPKKAGKKSKSYDDAYDAPAAPADAKRVESY
ncbi:MAG TPA: hypothetical protein VG389_16710 [Myxococcota bacterium]|jgi:hypothetical protein|nr:hypothetical protein [Myxococcota bacterium]